MTLYLSRPAKGNVVLVCFLIFRWTVYGGLGLWSSWKCRGVVPEVRAGIGCEAGTGIDDCDAGTVDLCRRGTGEKPVL